MPELPHAVEPFVFVAPNGHPLLKPFASLRANHLTQTARFAIFALPCSVRLLHSGFRPLRLLSFTPAHPPANMVALPMKLTRLLTLLCALALAFPSWVHADDAADAAKLKVLVDRQKTLFTNAAKSGNDLDEDNFRSQLQQLCNEYDALLRRSPRNVPALVSYAMLLGQVDHRKDSIALLLRANALDKNLPLVKNQLGNYLAEEGHPVEAMNYYLSAIQLEPKEPLYHYQFGTLLAEARDDFLKTGQWTRANLDKAMQDAFEKALQCAPDDWRYAYRYGLSFYEIELAEWEAALQFWESFEKKLKPGVEQQTCRLHQAKVHLAQKHYDEARALLTTVTEPVLAKQKEKLVAEFPTPETKK